MSQQWRILVVEGDEELNRGIVKTLAQDGYDVQGVATGSEAIRILWANEQHLVIADRALPDADGFELLRWARTYSPNTRVMMLAAPGSPGKRIRAMEYGAVAYFEKPVDLRLLKVEVRRLLQQTGFSANLDSFDLLDVIQIINMSRKSIALVVHTGLEEQGTLGFQDGELIWAEYGALRGEEAFFALAAHKNGMVTQQPWNGTMTSNVTQPLSRLILQALQYRSKYEASQQLSGEYRALSDQLTMHGDLDGESPLDEILTEAVDDRPFVYVAEASRDAQQGAQDTPNASYALDSQDLEQSSPQAQPELKPWWQESAKLYRAERPPQAQPADAGTTGENESPARETSHSGTQKIAGGAEGLDQANHRHSARRVGGVSRIISANGTGTSIRPSTVRKTPVGQRTDLPSWLMDQPTQFEIQALRPSALQDSSQVPAAPPASPSPAEWHPAQSPSMPGTTGDLSSAQSPQPPQPSSASMIRGQAPVTPVVPLASPVFGEPPAATAELAAPPAQASSETPVNVLFDLSTDQREGEQPGPAPRNYTALVSALQTVGYSLPGFITTAVVGIDGQPIAQVAVDGLDISGICAAFASLLSVALQSLDKGTWGQHEDTIITSATHHILLRIPGGATDVFQVLVTTRESDPVESLDVLASVEGAIVSAL